MSQLAMSSAIVLTLLVSAAATADPVTPFRATDRAELFVDDHIIASSKGVARTLHPARRMDRPVLEPEMPWEGQRLYIYGTVLRDEESGEFRMWYHASGSGILYAVSEDGITWTRPSLGIHEFEGSKDNNIVLPGVGNPTVYLDEAESDPTKRFKALAGSGRSIRGFHSPDGMRWTEYPQSPLIPFGSELVNIARDPESGEYLVYIRPTPPKTVIQEPSHKRTCSLTTSTDFVNWTPLKSLLVPDEIDDAWVRSPEQRTEFYSMAGFPYGSQFLGLIPVFRITGIIPLDARTAEQSQYDGPIDVQLVHSRDGRSWQRFEDRSAIIPNGPPGSYDAGTLLNIANNPLIVGDEVWYYYTAINTTHGGPMPPKRGAIALAKWRLDGFVSLRAHWAAGMVQTVPLTCEGGILEVNADAADGRLAVEVLGPDGVPIPGYSRDDCEVVSTDSVRHRITWRGGNTLPASESFVLRFHLTNSDLYSFRIRPGGE